MNIKYCLFILAISMSVLYPKGAEFRSCTTAVRIEKNLEEGEKWGLKALEKDPDDSYIPYYIGRYIYRPQKRIEEAGEMFMNALNKKNTKLDTPFRIGSGKKQIWIKTVHEAIGLLATDWFNYGIEAIEKENNEKAIKYLEMASTFDSKLKSKSYTAIALINFSNNNVDLAFKYLNIAIDASENSKEIIELKLIKLSFLRQQKEFDRAFEIYGTLPKEELSAIQRVQLFELYQHSGDCGAAIEMGQNLLPILEDDISTPMSTLSLVAYNMATCYKEIASLTYNEIINNWETKINNGDEKELTELLNKSEKCKAYYSSAKDYFRLSLDYDENPSETAKEYKREMRKKIRYVDDEIISTLEEKLSK